MQHFLDISDFSAVQISGLLKRAHQLKAKPLAEDVLANRSVGMIFEKPSTRTRVSFEVGIRQLGGQPLMLSSSDLQIGRGETIHDTAKVLSRYLDMVMIRCLKHETLMELANYADMPVINGLTNRSHPCQIMADMLTIEQRFGSLDGRIISWFGDGNNVLNSWIDAAALFDFELRIAGPAAYHPDETRLAEARAKGARILVTDNAIAAAENADVLMTDVWISMGDDEGTRRQDLSPFQVNDSLMSKAKDKAIFMHCLPAWRDMEVSAEVIDGPQSAVFDQAENRLHAQKAVMGFLAEHMTR